MKNDNPNKYRKPASEIPVRIERIYRMSIKKKLIMKQINDRIFCLKSDSSPNDSPQSNLRCLNPCKGTKECCGTNNRHNRRNHRLLKIKIFSNIKDVNNLMKHNEELVPLPHIKLEDEYIRQCRKQAEMEDPVSINFGLPESKLGLLWFLSEYASAPKEVLDGYKRIQAHLAKVFGYVIFPLLSISSRYGDSTPQEFSGGVRHILHTAKLESVVDGDFKALDIFASALSDIYLLDSRTEEYTETFEYVMFILERDIKDLVQIVNNLFGNTINSGIGNPVIHNLRILRRILFPEKNNAEDLQTELICSAIRHILNGWSVERIKHRNLKHEFKQKNE